MRVRSAICRATTGTADSLPLDGDSVFALISKGERANCKCCPQVLWITDDVFDNDGNVRLSVELRSFINRYGPSSKYEKITKHGSGQWGNRFFFVLMKEEKMNDANN